MMEEESGHYLDKLDTQQKAASTVDRNSVITAGAGAGKTTVLASRYIHLVVEKKIPVRSILALTFTRKAAAEMYERIYGALASITTPWAFEQLADFQNAHITTLDSFCAEIVRQAARDFGYSPEFAIDDEKSIDIAQGIAYRFVIRNRDRPGIKEALQSFPFDTVASLLFGDLGARQVTPLALNEQYFSPMKEKLKALADEKASEAIRNLLQIAGSIIDRAPEAAAPKADCVAAIDCSKAFVKTFAEAGKKHFVLSDFAGHFSAFAKLTMRSYGRNEAEQAIKEMAKEAKEKAGTLLDFADYEAMFPAHCALLERLDEFASEVAEAKRLADVMDFKDLGACAVDILKRRKDIRTFWKSGIDSIMIDEFQDNNELQKNLLYLLAEKKGRESDDIPLSEDLEDGKLFFVGDEKQSIY
ncbi:MAG TPA: UvrD-helicase domain-containing protein, partial [Rectinemataceae bacterium]|nr:UvrD-helicase domain-containing protein [Rectinemataceae bacterium]